MLSGFLHASPSRLEDGGALQRQAKAAVPSPVTMATAWFETEAGGVAVGNKGCSHTGTVVLISWLQRQTLPPGVYTQTIGFKKKRRIPKGSDKKL